jgi:hypothetical protein
VDIDRLLRNNAYGFQSIIGKTERQETGETSVSTINLWKLKGKIYENIILPVLYGCETWSVTLGEEHRLENVWT